MNYTAVIRTLGTAGEKYQRELYSLCNQTMPPNEILVYLAEGYPIPKETCGREKYIYVKKGMVAQRALSYDEIDSEYILFLDDDVYLPPNGVENLFAALRDNDASVISPDVFDNASRPILPEILMTVSGRMRARRGDDEWGYKVLRTGGYSYNKSPQNRAYLSQTNAGPCFLCKKSDFLAINFSEELWMDRMGYPIGEDQAMFYKMHLLGLKQMTLFGSGIIHLDAGNNLGNKEKEKNLVAGDYFFKLVFWKRFIFEPEKNVINKICDIAAISYWQCVGLTISLLKLDIETFKIKIKALNKAIKFLKSQEFKSIPKITKKCRLK